MSSVGREPRRVAALVQRGAAGEVERQAQAEADAGLAPRATPCEHLLGGEQVDAAELVVVAPVAPGRAVRALLSSASLIASSIRSYRSVDYLHSVRAPERRFRPGGRTMTRRAGLRRLRRRAPPRARPTSSRPACPSTSATAAVWEEDFELDEPFVEGGARVFRRLHTPGFEGWTISRYRQTGGRTPEGDPELILEDMDLDGVDAAGDAPEPLAVRALLRRPRAVDGPRPRLQRLRRRAVLAVLRPHRARPRRSRSPTSTTPSPRSSGSPPPGSGPSCCRPRRRRSYYTRDLDPVWAALQATGVQPFFHTQTGGVKVNDTEADHAQGGARERRAGQPADDREGGGQADGHAGRYSTLVPQQLICQLIGGGVPERYPDLHFSLIEFNAHWLSSLVGGMDKCWVTGIGQDADWWLGMWDDTRPPTTSRTWPSCSGSTRSGRTR